LSKTIDQAFKRRYEILPQMQTYAGMRPSWVPHLMYNYQPNLRSEVCNTDEHGFRFTHRNDAVLDYSSFLDLSGPKGLLCGSGAAFGVGATADSETIASKLNQNSDTAWFNFAGPPHTSTSELLKFQLFLPKVERVVLFTGLNNLALHTSSPLFSEVYGSIFLQSSFQLLNQAGTSSEFLRYALRRLPGRMSRVWKRFLPSRKTTSSLVEAPDFQTRYQQSLAILRRDLDVWASLRDRLGFSLLFVLQPRTAWMGKKLSKEEQELQDIYSTVALGPSRWGAAWQNLEGPLNNIYPTYRDDTNQLCRERDIQWADANQLLPKDGWLFCDYANMTDRGQELSAELILSSQGASD